MESHLFIGEVLPERAQLSLDFGMKFLILTSRKEASAKVSVMLNKIAVTIEAEEEINIFDLRNVVRDILHGHLAILGYIRGYAYDVEITRVINPIRNIDYVFGIDIPELAVRDSSFDPEIIFKKVQEKSMGTDGIFVRRCLNDLVSAMKYADDTGFYCFRAIEALHHHCAAVNGLVEKSRAAQWEKFRKIINFTEAALQP